jgi:hypothetical protein
MAIEKGRKGSFGGADHVTPLKACRYGYANSGRSVRRN